MDKDDHVLIFCHVKNKDLDIKTWTKNGRAVAKYPDNIRTWTFLFLMPSDVEFKGLYDGGIGFDHLLLEIFRSKVKLSNTFAATVLPFRRET